MPTFPTSWWNRHLLSYRMFHNKWVSFFRMIDWVWINEPTPFRYYNSDRRDTASIYQIDEKFRSNLATENVARCWTLDSIYLSICGCDYNRTFWMLNWSADGKQFIHNVPNWKLDNFITWFGSAVTSVRKCSFREIFRLQPHPMLAMGAYSTPLLLLVLANDSLAIILPWRTEHVEIDQFISLCNAWWIILYIYVYLYVIDGKSNWKKSINLGQVSDEKFHISKTYNWIRSLWNKHFILFWAFSVLKFALDCVFCFFFCFKIIDW